MWPCLQRRVAAGRHLSPPTASSSGGIGGASQDRSQESYLHFEVEGPRLSLTFVNKSLRPADGFCKTGVDGALCAHTETHLHTQTPPTHTQTHHAETHPHTCMHAHTGNLHTHAHRERHTCTRAHVKAAGVGPGGNPTPLPRVGVLRQSPHLCASPPLCAELRACLEGGLPTQAPCVGSTRSPTPRPSGTQQAH